MFQFLVEALVLCLVGGLIGVLFGSLGALILSKLAHWNTLISPLAILLAFVFSAAVGLFFGIWPARRPRVSIRLSRCVTNRRRNAEGGTRNRMTG